MAFVVEDGTGLHDANSLVSVEYADEYFLDRAIPKWGTLTLAIRRAALLQASAYVATQYNFKGQRLYPDQGTPFPRVGVTDEFGNTPNGVPKCVKQVTCELAIRASSGALIQDPAIDEGGRPVKMKQLRVGTLHKTIEFAGNGDILEMSRYPAVDALMCPWLIQQETKFTNGVKLVGAVVSGISNSEIFEVASNPDRYIGPINENAKDVDEEDGNGII